MKKIIIVIFLILTLVLCTGIVFADELDEPVIGDDDPEYVHANSADSYLTISGSKATCTTTVIKKSSSTANKMVVTTYYYKSGGTYVGSASTTAYNSGNSFVGTTSKTLSSHGTYYAEALVKLYNNSTFLESFTLVTGNATY